MARSILEDRRALVERLANVAEIIGVVGGFALALAVCFPEGSSVRGGEVFSSPWR